MAEDQDQAAAAAETDAAVEAIVAVVDIDTDVASPDDAIRVLAPAFVELRNAVERLPQTPLVEAALGRLRELVDISGR